MYLDVELRGHIVTLYAFDKLSDCFPKWPPSMLASGVYYLHNLSNSSVGLPGWVYLSSELRTIPLWFDLYFCWLSVRDLFISLICIFITVFKWNLISATVDRGQE